MKTGYRMIVGVFGILMLAMSSQGAPVTWSGGNTTWSQPDSDSFSATYNSGDDVTFGDTGVGTVTLTNTVTPGSVLFTNTSGTYTLSGGKIGGNGLITKTGAGTVQVNTSTDILTNSGTGGIGLTVQAGTFYIRADSSRTYTLFGNSATAIKIDGGTFSFRPNGTLNTLANAVQVTTNGGTLDTIGYSGNGLRTILNGSLAFGGNLTWTVGSGGTPPGGTPPYRDNLNGTVTLDGDRKLTLSGSDPGGPVTIGGNITQDASARKLTLAFTNFSPGLILSGDNTGLTGGIDLALLALPDNSVAMARFANANAMGGGGASSIFVPSNTAVGFDFAPTATDLARIKSGSAGMAMLGTNSSQDIDFSPATLNADMRLGACPGTTNTYTGTLTPYGSTYRIGGGGTLILPNNNALTGNRNVIVGPGSANEKTSAGVLVLSGTNNYTGTTTVSYASGGSYPLVLGTNNALPVTTVLITTALGGVDLNGFSQEVAGYKCGGYAVRNLSTTQSVFTINPAVDDNNPQIGQTLSGNIALVKKGPKLLVIRANEAYTGPTTVLGGKLQMFQNGSGALPSTAMTVDGTNAVLDLTYYWTPAAWNPTNSSLTVDHGGAVSNSGTIRSTFTASAYDLRDGTVAVALAGPAATLTKSTTGTVILSGTNTYGGSTIVNAGTLTVTSSGSLASTNWTIATNAVLAFGSAVNLAGKVLTSDGGGATGGLLTVAGNLTLGGKVVVTGTESRKIAQCTGTISGSFDETVLPNPIAKLVVKNSSQELWLEIPKGSCFAFR